MSAPATQTFRFRKLGYAALNVTDLDRSLEFYRDIFGLEQSGPASADTAFLRCSRDHHNLVLYKGEQPGIKRIGFEMESERDLDETRRRLEELNVEHHNVPAAETAALHQGHSLRFRIPGCGVLIELYASMEQMPTRYNRSVADILRLGHVVLATPNVEATATWLTESFGFRGSDYIENGFFAFLRCHPNPYHHTLALTHSPVNRFHHVAFMVRDMADIGKAMNRLRRHNVKVVFGPGQHVASGSVFYYFLDPDRMTVEYTCGMEEFPESAPRPSRMLVASPATADEWGGVPDPEYGKVGTVE